MKTIEDFGCSVSSPDNTAALQAAVDSGEGALLIPPREYRLGGLVTISASLRLFGESLAAKLAGTDPAQDMLRVVTDDPVEFKCFRIGTAVAKTGGRAISFSPAVQNNFSSVKRVIFEGQWQAIDFERAAYWQMEGCHCIYNVPGGTLVKIRNLTTPDAGDAVMACNQFYGGAGVTHVRYEGGGGLRVMGNKFLQGANGIDLSATPGVVTGILAVHGNSFDGQSSTALSMTNLDGTSSFTNIAVNGNIFNGSPSNTFIYAAQIPGIGGIGRTAISGNVLIQDTGSVPLIVIANGGDYCIVGNSINGGGGHVGLYIGAAVTNSVVGPNSLEGVTLANNSPSTKVWN